jgi:hypothetical protein
MGSIPILGTLESRIYGHHILGTKSPKVVTLRVSIGQSFARPIIARRNSIRAARFLGSDDLSVGRISWIRRFMGVRQERTQIR